MEFNFNDGGRAATGRKGFTGDCVCRSIAITSGLPYEDVYQVLANGMGTQRKTKRSSKGTGKYSASKGVSTRRKWFKDYMESLGYTWVPCMGVGTGCKVHMKADELPAGRIICVVSRHYSAVIDGVINDTYDPSRNGTRCVYGYWKIG